jgi:hypothetical protein
VALAIADARKRSFSPKREQQRIDRWRLRAVGQHHTQRHHYVRRFYAEFGMRFFLDRRERMFRSFDRFELLKYTHAHDVTDDANHVRNFHVDVVLARQHLSIALSMQTSLYRGTLTYEARVRITKFLFACGLERSQRFARSRESLLQRVGDWFI